MPCFRGDFGEGNIQQEASKKQSAERHAPGAERKELRAESREQEAKRKEQREKS